MMLFYCGHLLTCVFKCVVEQGQIRWPSGELGGFLVGRYTNWTDGTKKQQNKTREFKEIIRERSAHGGVYMDGTNI